MKSRYLILIVLILLLFASCSNIKENPEMTDVHPNLAETGKPETGYPVEPEVELPSTAYPISDENPPISLEESAARVIQAMAEKDLVKLAEFVHPVLGLRFSPYAFVREDHLVLMANELPDLVESGEVYEWGSYDGTGEPIALTFDAYYDEFVYSADFANPEQTAVNERIGQGNSINNIDAFFPGSSFVEYHFNGFDAQYEGMDWQSLRLVFVKEGEVWFLVVIVHDEWTI